jgi:TP901 family phage tail tape measure protein
MAATSGGIKAGKAFILIEALDQTSPMLSKIERKLLQWGRKMQGLGKSIMMGSIMAFTPTIMAGKVFTEFDDAMRKVEARSSGTGKEMAALRDQAKKLGRETAFTAGQIGELQAKLAQGGFNRKEISNMTEPIMLLARAAGEGFDIGQDATTAARLVSGTIRSFQMHAEDAARVSDLLTATVNNSAYSLEGLLVSFQYAGTTAKEFNIPLEETLATLGGLSRLQIDPSIAGTAFRNMASYMSSAKGREDFNATLKEATGNTIDFVDESDNLRKLPELLFAIGKATREMGSAGKADLLGHLFGIRAMVPAAALARDVNPFAELMTQYEEAQGLARRTHDAMESGPGGAWRLLASAVEGAALSIGDSLEPAFNALAASTAALFTWTATYLSENKDLVVRFVLATAGAFTFGLSLYVLGTALTMVASVIGIVRVAFLALWTTTKLIVNGMLLLKSIATITVGTLSSLKFIVIAISAVFKAASLTVAFFNGVLTVMSFINTAASATAVILSTAILGVNYAILYTVLQWAIYIAIIGAVILAVGLLVAQFIKLDIAIYQMIQSAGSGLASFFGPILEYIGKIPGAFKEAGSAISTWFMSMAEKGKALGSTLYGTFEGIVAAMEMGDTQAAWDVAIMGLTTAWHQFEDMLYGTWDTLCDFIADAWTGAMATVRTAWTKTEADLTQGFIDLGWIVDVDALSEADSKMNKKFMELKKRRIAEGEDVAANEKGLQGFRGVGGAQDPYGREVVRIADGAAKQIADIQDKAGKKVSDRQTARDAAQAERDAKIAREKAILNDKLQDIADLRAYHRKEYEDKIAGSFEANAAAFGANAEGLINAEGGITGAAPAKAQEGFIKGSIEAAKRAYENSEGSKKMQTEDLLKQQLGKMDKQLEALENLLGALDAA